MDRRPVGVACVALVVLGAGVVGSHAGSINPPAGPVAPTHKTLTEVEPRIAINATNTPGDADSLFKITEPGSYYLTGNITGVAGKHGIEIAMSDPAAVVSVDLKGFVVTGGPGTLSGIRSATASRVTLVDGAVRGWEESGVDLGNSSRCVVRGIRAEGNTFHGVLTGSHAVIADCVVSGNGPGAQAGEASVVERCRIEGNAGVGLTVLVGSTARDCSSTLNGSHGYNFSGTAWNCGAYDNQGSGFFVQSGASLYGCTATSNGTKGFEGNDNITIHDCTANNNAAEGIRLNSDGRIEGCTTNNNGAEGIRVISGGRISDCQATDNGGDGIHAGPVTPMVVVGTEISGCTTGTNGGDGIEVFLECRVIGNTCHTNGVSSVGAGIRVSNDRNHIEGNRVAGNDVGVDVGVAGANVIVGNRAHGNAPNFVVNSATNIVGTVVTSDAAMNAAANNLVNLSF